MTRQLQEAMSAVLKVRDMAKKAGDMDAYGRWENLYRELEKGGKGMAELSAITSSANQAYIQFKANLTDPTPLQAFGQRVQKITSWMTSVYALFMAINAMKSAVGTIIAMEKARIDLQRSWTKPQQTSQSCAKKPLSWAESLGATGRSLSCNV